MKFTGAFLWVLLLACHPAGKMPSSRDAGSVFAKDNLVAWCIVPFDSKKRSPEQRAEMLDSLGIRNLAYDWRQEHIAEFDAELMALKKHGITLTAFWYMSGLTPEKDSTLQLIFDLLEKHQVKTQIWLMMVGEGSLTAMAGPVAYIANKAARIGCRVGLYNHGGWYGEPENQLAIIEHLKLPNLGIVYNFSHAEYQAHRFPEFFPKILPHLYAINITGLRGGYPAVVVPVGQGNLEDSMMRLIRESSYRGPIGIINEDFAPDAKDGLMMNLQGIEKILQRWKDGTKPAAK